MRKKLRDSSGLTLVETLCAVLILVLLCLMLNSGLSMAVKSYCDITAESETQLLLSSLADALADKLRYCVVTEKSESGTTNYTNSIGVVEANSTTHRVTVDGKELLPEGAYGEANASGNRRYQAETLMTSDYSGPVPIFTVTLTVKDTQTNISKETARTVRCLNPVKKEETPS